MANIAQLLELDNGRIVSAGNKTLDASQIAIDVAAGNLLTVVDGALRAEVDLSSYATSSDLSTAVSTAIAEVVDGAPTTFDTLKEIADWIEGDGVNATDKFYLENAFSNTP